MRTQWTITAALLAAVGIAQDPVEQPVERPAPTPYQRALNKAARDNQRLLVIEAAAEVEAGDRVEAVLKDRELRRFVLYEFQTVRIAGAEGREPELVVRAGDGAELARTGIAGVLGAEGAAARLRAFLEPHVAKPVDARALYAAALREAEQSGRRVLVHLGAPW